MTKKNCTCSLLQETIDKIFIDDSCCCQNTVVTPTNNCCSCEPVIDLIDTDKFACASFGNDRNLKYRMIREEWLTGGTNSKEVYDIIIDSQASGVMLLIKVIRNNVNENSKNYVLPPLEVSLDIESGIYFIKYFKLIGENLHLCTYTIRQVNNDGIILYETSWESKAIDDFDLSLYYNKTEIDNKFTTIINNYYTRDTIEANFYRIGTLYSKEDINNMFASKILWEKGKGNLSTQRISARCDAKGDASFVTGLDNSGNSTGTTVTGVENKVTGDYSTATGYKNIVNGMSNLAAGNNNEIKGNHSIVTGQSNTINGDYNFAGGQNNKIYSNLSGTIGNNNLLGDDETDTQEGSCSFATGKFNTIKNNYSLAAGSSNTVKGRSSAALGSDNVTNGNSSFALGFNNTSNSYYSLALNEQSRSNGISSISGGRRSYTELTGSCAIGSPVDVNYYAKLVSTNTTDPYYGYLVLTTIDGTPINIDQTSIAAKRFKFTAENKYCGELTVSLTNAERQNAWHTSHFPLNNIYPQLVDVKFVNNKLYFKTDSTEDVIGLFTNIIQDANGWGQGVRSIRYASGFDGCKAIDIGSHAEGYGTIANGKGSHSEGVNTYTLNDGEHACGTYNYSTKINNETINDETLFSIGIGNQEYVKTQEQEQENINNEDGTNVVIHRKNVLEITKDNKIYLRIKEENNEALYDLGKMLDLLMTNVLTSAQIDSLKVLGREANSNNTDVDALVNVQKTGIKEK